ncbi:ABC transporter permease subunit [Candidatus Latescibacterota bacterium]
MIHLRAIGTIARCEARLLWRSWAFRLSIGFGVFVLFLYNLAMSSPTSGIAHLYVALPGSTPLGNVKLLNLYLGIVAAFLATEFVKRDRQQDTIQTVLVHSFTNLDYTAGKVLGVVSVFATLEVAVLIIAGVLQHFFAPAPISWHPYAMAVFAAALPTLIFTVGLAVLLVTLLRSQALVLVIMVGLGMLTLMVLGHRYHYFFDTFAFHIPLMWSDFMGAGNERQLLLVRGAHLLFGLGCVAVAPLLSSRLHQSRLANGTTALMATACIAGAAWASSTYWQERWEDDSYRETLRAVSGRSAGLPAPTITHCRLQVEHAGRRLAVVADLVVTNANAASLDTLVFTLNPGLDIEEVTSEGAHVAFRREEHVVLISPRQALASGDSCRLQLIYEGAIDERFCYLDVEPERLAGHYRFWLNTVPKAYAVVTPRFLHLTAESGWYPRGGLPPGTAFPAAGHREYARYEIQVEPTPGWTAFSQGEVRVDSVSGKYHFRSENPLPQVSLTMGEYEIRELAVEGVTYRLAFHPDHDYFDTYLDSVAGALPELIPELKNEYEAALGLEYPHRRFSLVEVPIQLYAYQRLWTVAQESVQPEMVFLPEMGTLCEGADLKRQKRRSRYSQERANQAETAEDLQSDYLRTFATLDLLGLQEAGYSRIRDESNVETRFLVLPNYVSYVTHLSSGRWPVLNQAFEAYYRERVAPPENTYMRQWTGLTSREEANLALQETPLVEMLEDEELERGLREAAINAKGTHLLQLFAAAVGVERFGDRLDQAVEESRYRGLFEGELTGFMADLGVTQFEELVDGWYRTTQMPGYEVGAVESYLVRDGERTRTQVKLEVTNPSEVDGLVEISFRYRQADTQSWWMRVEGQADYRRVVAIPAGSRVELGIVVDRPVAELMVDTYVSQNIPAVISIPFQEQTLRRGAVPREVEEVSLLADDPPPEQAVYVVDNEDEGFEVHEAEQANWLRRLMVDAFDLRDRRTPYSALRPWEAPGTWEPTTERHFYGRFVLSGYYKRAGDGRSVVSWRTEVARAGDYEIYFYCGPLDALKRGRRHRGRWRNENYLNIVVHHDGGTEEVPLDMHQAEEGWNPLGTFHLGAGPAHVELTDRATGRVVIADAVKWVERI